MKSNFPVQFSGREVTDAREKWTLGGGEGGKLEGETSTPWISTDSGTSFRKVNGPSACDYIFVNRLLADEY